MTWQPEIDEIRRREALAKEMGGAERVGRQKAQGKLTVRERIDALLDPGSFHEIGAIAGKGVYKDDNELAEFRPGNILFGRGRIRGRPVVVQGDDFSVRGGAADAALHQKLVRSEQLANEYRWPLIRLVDGTGGGGSVKTLIDKDARTYIPVTPGWEIVADNLAEVPVVALALGPCAGLGAGRVAASHYSVMVEGLSQVFVAGPPVVKATGEDVTKEELGGSEMQTRNGVVDDEVESETEAFSRARRFLSYLPSSVHELPPRVTPTDDPGRRDPWLLEAVPRDRRKVYKMRRIIEAAVDQGSFFEMGRFFGRSLITGFARLDGWPVAVMGNDPYHYGGAISADAALKMIRFIDLAEVFHLPVVNFVDNPGFLVGTFAERAGVVRHGTRAMQAVYQATVPWATILIRKAYGLAGSAQSNPKRYQYRYCWPSGDWGSLPFEGGIEAAFRRDLEGAADPAAMLQDIRKRMEAVRSPFRTAEAFLAEEIIDPRETRPLLCEFANLAAPLRKTGRVSFAVRP